MNARTLLASTLAVALAAVILETVLLSPAQASPAPAGASSGDEGIIAALLEGWSGSSAAPGSISGPGLVRQATPTRGTLITRGDPGFIYDGNLSVVNLGDSDVEFGLSDGTVLMTVPAGGSSTLRPFVCFPPDELVYTSRSGTLTEFVWVSRDS